MAWETRDPDERGVDVEAGTPELPERSAPPSTPIGEASVSPGLVCVATISLASPPRASGACRCDACLVLPESVDAWFA